MKAFGKYLGRLLTLTSGLLVLAASHDTSAAIRTYVTGGNWSTAGTWDGIPAVSGDSFVWSNNGLGTTSTLQQNYSNIGLTVNNTTVGAHTVDLNGFTLAFDVASARNWYVGQTTANAVGDITFRNGSITNAAALNTGINFRIGQAANTTIAGTLTLGTSSQSVTLNLTGVREMLIGYNGNSASSGSAQGILDMTYANGTFAGSLGATINGLRVGYGPGGNGTVVFGSGLDVDLGTSANRIGTVQIGLNDNAVSGTTKGLVTYSGANKTVYTSQTRVGYGANTAGAVTIIATQDMSAVTSSGSEYNQAGGEFRIGYRVGAGTGDIAAAAKFGDHAVNIGTSASRTDFIVGRRALAAHGDDTVNATVSQLSGGTFNAFIGTTFDVGLSANLIVSGADAAAGTLDLSGADSVAIDSTAVLNVGVGRNTTGTMHLPTGTFVTTAAINIGDADNTPATSGGSGLLRLTGTQVTGGTGSILTVGKSGDIINDISDVSSGVTLARAVAGALNLPDFTLGDVRLTLNFDDPNFTPTTTLPYWGFRWAGDDLAEATSFATTLATYINEAGSSFTAGDGRIDVAIVGGSNLVMSDLNVGTYLDGGVNYAYIGFTDFDEPVVLIPEPSTIFLLLVGGGLLYRRWGRNAN